MAGTIQSNNLGLSIFGTAQVDYIVGDESGCSYDLAVARAGLQRAAAVEEAIPAMTRAVKERQTKADNLGFCLACIGELERWFDDGSRELDGYYGMGDTYEESRKVFDILNMYDLNKSGYLYFEKDYNGGKYVVKRKHIGKLKSEVSYAVDVNNNDLQQEIAALQNMISKRDNAYQMATKLMKKAVGTRSNGVRNIG